MSPAKRKPAPRAKAKSRKPAARTRAKPKARHRSATCTLSSRRLAELFDRDDRAALLAHVPGCPGCAARLTVLSANRESLIRLIDVPEGGTAVERVLARGVRSGRRRLADLVYELAKACLVVVQDIDRRLHLATRPRDVEAIGRDVRAVGSRLPPRVREETAKLPVAKPDESRALAAAESCIRILEHEEGKSERQRLAWSVWLICAGRPAEAEGVLRGMVEGVASPFCRRSIHHNLAWALSRQRCYEAALQVSEKALAEFPNDWLLAYNASVSAALAGNEVLAERHARRLRDLQSAEPLRQHQQRSQLTFEIPRIAEKLRLSEVSVARWFGLNRLAGVGGDHE